MNGKSICLSMFLAGALSACSTCKPIYITSAIPSPPSIARPILETSKITPTTSEGEVVVDYRVTMQQLLDYSTSLEKIVETYRSIANKQGNNKNE